MELIRDLIEWFAQDGGSTLATLFPYMLVGLLGLYLLWLVVGYLRVSQVGIRDGHVAQPVVALPGGGADADADAADRPRGVPYCSVDSLQYPIGARFCARCERDLAIDCSNCGATLAASDASCYRCGTRTGVADTAHLS